MVAKPVVGKTTDGPVSRTINRKISKRITEFILRKNIPVTPNQVSFISFLLALMGSLLYLPRLDPLAGLLVQISSIVDGVDGELARARGQTSPLGAFLDSILDRLADAAVVIALTIVSAQTMPLISAVVGSLALLGCLMVSYVHSQGRAALKTHVGVVGKVPMFASRDVRLFLVFIASFFYVPLVTLALLALITMSYVIAKTIDTYFQFKVREVK